ncbi:MAG: hypothetical protein ACRDTD_28705 [Pseudonocardiaceae bacterium]
MQIGSGPPAPGFDIVSRPNDWQKTVKTAGNAAEARANTPVNAARQALFTDILTDANPRQPAISIPTPQKGNWIAFASGPFGNWDMTVFPDGRLRVDAYNDADNRDLHNVLFDEFAADADTWQTQCGAGSVLGAARRQTRITHRYLQAGRSRGPCRPRSNLPVGSRRVGRHVQHPEHATAGHIRECVSYCGASCYTHQ